MQDSVDFVAKAGATHVLYGCVTVVYYPGERSVVVSAFEGTHKHKHKHKPKHKHKHLILA